MQTSDTDKDAVHLAASASAASVVLETGNPEEAASAAAASAAAAAPACVSPSSKSPEPPDGGWGWAVVGASFFAHLIADGCGFSFGVLFSELLEVFGESKSRTAWVGSLFVSVPAICGPVASALTNRYGCRVTTLMGGIIGSAGCLMSAFADSIGQLCFTFGIVAGFGLSLVFVPAVVIVAFYFKKKRGLATGLSVAGSGIGTFIFAPLTELLIDHYQWRGALMITAGILLNIVVCGALFRPLDDVKDRILLNDDGGNDSHNNNTTTSSSTNAQWLLSSVDVKPHNMQMNPVAEESPDVDSSIAPRFVSRSHPEFLLCAHMTHADADADVTRRPCVVQSLILLPFREQSAKKSLETSSLLGTPVARRIQRGDYGGGGGGGHGRIGNSLSRFSVVSCNGDRCRFGSFDVGRQHCREFEIPANRSQSFDSHRRRRNDGLGRAILGVQCGRPMKPGLSNSDRCVYLRRQDIVYRGSLLKAGFFLNNGRSASCPNVFISSEEQQGLLSRLQSVAKKLLGKAISVVDFSVCRSKVFNYFCLHTILLYISYDIPYVYGPVRAMVHGISEDYAPILVAIIGIFSTIGQVVMGYVGDQMWVNVLYFYNAMTSIAGLLTVLVPFVFAFLPTSFLYAGYGFFISANFALTTVILVELLGMQKLTNAFGMVSLAQGIANLFGPPLAGWLSDVTGSYDPAFYGAGLTIMVSGLMLFAAPYLAVLDGSSPLFRMTMNDLPVYLNDDAESDPPPPNLPIPASKSTESNSLCRIVIRTPSEKRNDPARADPADVGGDDSDNGAGRNDGLGTSAAPHRKSGKLVNCRKDETRVGGGKEERGGGGEGVKGGVGGEGEKEGSGGCENGTRSGVVGREGARGGVLSPDYEPEFAFGDRRSSPSVSLKREGWNRMTLSTADSDTDFG